jgi:hypothetical protein
MIHGTPISKITRAKWTRGVAQEVGHLLCKHKDLSANPNPTTLQKIQGRVCLLFQLLLNIVLELLAKAIRKEKEIKAIQKRKEVKLSLFEGDRILYMKDPKNSTKNSWI